MRIGVFGGSFDPVHNGHLALASYAAAELGLDKVIFLPSHQNPLKKESPWLPEALRLTLLRKVIRNKPAYSVSELELKRGGKSYTVDTLRALHKKYGPKTQLFFLAGADCAKNFSRWKSSREVLKLCRFVVMTRPGSPVNSATARFLTLSMPPVDISSSEIRRKLERRRSLRGLVPKEIEEVLERSRRGKSKPKRK